MRDGLTETMSCWWVCCSRRECPPAVIRISISSRRMQCIQHWLTTSTVGQISVLNKSICRPGPGDVSLADLIGDLRGLALENPRALLVCSSMRLLTSRFICFASMLLRLILFSMLHQYAHCNKGANKSPAEDQVYCTLQVSYLQCTWQTKFRSLPCLLLNLVVQDGNMALFRNDYNALTLKQV
ncbi:hypothetical protein PVAP13_3KG519800 [Panicum virgatum]|uniref:Uncharacterized protein n=1 Tax=Panicum virgatum TaxID=38727 RepID=A0A8T0V623_PANVG|nr:hypothetical protein PVAP13_3KG519800 [Panicum virgatum]